MNGAGSHSRSSSFAGILPPGTPTSGSGGRAELRRIASTSEFEKYTEDDEDEDYEDVFFGKAVGTKDGAGHANGIQTLQLNTRLSNKSWVGHILARPKQVSQPFDSLAMIQTKRIRSQRYVGRCRNPFMNIDLQQIDDHLAEDDLETNLQRDKYARLCSTVNGLIDELTPAAPDFQLREACDTLVSLFKDSRCYMNPVLACHSG